MTLKTSQIGSVIVLTILVSLLAMAIMTLGIVATLA
jgi:hypothetical protein